MPQYPLDENTDQYAGKIMFIPVAEKYIDAAASVRDVLSTTTSAVENFSEGRTNSNNTEISDPRQEAFRYGKRDTKVYSVPLTSYNSKASAPVTLYLPQAINIADTVNYETINLGIMGAGALAGVQSGAGFIEAAYNELSKAGKSALDISLGRKKMSAELAALASVRLANNSPGDTVRGVVGSALGVAVNPNTRSLFKSVNLREFTFTFKMIASSAAEANQIEQIIKIFRTELYPEDIKTGNVSVGYIFPNKFDIIMTYKGQRVATRFLRSYLRNVQTVYNPSSMGWHVDGKPSEVDLTISFAEPRTLSKSDIRDGY